jgi:vesicle-fusing ATPase
VSDQDVALNGVQRKCCSFTLEQSVIVTPFRDLAAAALTSLTVTVDLFVKKAGQATMSLDVNELSEAFRKSFVKQVFRVGQSVAFDFNGTKLDVAIEQVEHPDFDGASKSVSPLGQVLLTTTVQFKRAPGSQSPISIVGGAGPGERFCSIIHIDYINSLTWCWWSNFFAARNDNLFKSDFNFEAMGIGGLDEQFKKMFRTAFASRVFPGLVKQLGTNHVRGMLLYGPPGCGKVGLSFGTVAVILTTCLRVL